MCNKHPFSWCPNCPEGKFQITPSRSRQRYAAPRQTGQEAGATFLVRVFIISPDDARIEKRADRCKIALALTEQTQKAADYIGHRNAPFRCCLIDPGRWRCALIQWHADQKPDRNWKYKIPASTTQV